MCTKYAAGYSGGAAMMEVKNNVTIGHCWKGLRVFMLAHRRWGTVTVINTNTDYPIVITGDDGTIASFTADGRYLPDQAPELFYGPPTLVGPELPPKGGLK